jgi:hypothetical protein
LKKRVLPALQEQQVIEKIHTTRTLTPADIEQRLPTTFKVARRRREEALSGKPVSVWLWQLQKNVPPKEEKTPEKRPFGWEVGVGQDWSHLSKRRAQSRQEKIQRDTFFLDEVRKARLRLESEQKAMGNGD